MAGYVVQRSAAINKKYDFEYEFGQLFEKHSTHSLWIAWLSVQFTLLLWLDRLGYWRGEQFQDTASTTARQNHAIADAVLRHYAIGTNP